MSTFDIVGDSSVWYNPRSFKAVAKQDTLLYTGTVRSVQTDEETGELRYMVEVYHRGDTIPTSCRMLRRFGGAFNYEDVVLRGYDYKTPQSLAAKAGDLVLVGMLGGQGREGVILGGLTHPTRPNIEKENGPEYKSEFNGIETYINKDGEYTLTFKAQPTNLKSLSGERSDPVPAPAYDTDVGSSFLKWDKTGSFLLADNAKSNPQKFFIDKKNGTIELSSGSVSLKLDKANAKAEITASSFVLSSPDIKLGGSAASEQAIHGTSYRAQETTMNSALSANFTALAASLTTAGSSLSTAGVDPTFAGIAPKAAAAISAAGTAITAAVATVTAMAAAVTAFEASSPLYLSNVVKVQ